MMANARCDNGSSCPGDWRGRQAKSNVTQQGHCLRCKVCAKQIPIQQNFRRGNGAFLWKTICYVAFAWIVSQAVMQHTRHVSWPHRAWAYEPGRDLSVADALVRTPPSSAKVVFAAIARDNMPCIEEVVGALVRIGQHFQEFAFVIAENDSTDGTKEYLADLATNESLPFSFQVLGQDHFVHKRPNISFLAKMRNVYLTEIYGPAYDDYDYVVVFDADFRGQDFASDGSILSSLDAHEDWAVIAANGEKGGKMYDAFAFRTERENHPYIPADFPGGISSYFPTIYHMQQKYEAGPLIPVLSAFGGLAIYRKAILQGLFHDEASEDCEHVSLHDQIRNRGGKIFMNPNMTLTYL